MAKKKNDTGVVRQTEYRSKKKVTPKKVSNEALSTKDVEKTLPTENKIINEEKEIKKEDYKVEKKGRKVFVNFFLCFVLLVGLASFGLNLYISRNSFDIYSFIGPIVLILFTIFFVPVGLKSKNKLTVFISSLLLGGYFGLNIYTSLTTGEINTFSSGVKDFSNKNLTEAVKWAEENNITLKQEYEYSDMVSEYKIITQDVKSGSKLDDVKELTVVVSEGPNPSKEVIVPDMTSWNDERVINFVEDNFLSNVEIEFVSSDKTPDTVIEQSKAGNLKRDEGLKITFSYGEELGYEEVKLIDFTKDTEFEVMFYMKQHHLNYEFDREFSNKIKRNLAMKQSVEPGKMVKIEDETIKVTFSKGKEIEVPNLTDMSVTKITEWIIENRLKLELSDQYDEKVKANSVISANYKKGDKIEQGETVKIVVSKGSLKMPKFKSFEDFRAWADKYSIKYEERHEFNSDFKVGEVISYSYKNGEVIKNDDVIIVTISDGEAIKVPALDGLSRSEAEKRLQKLNLKCSCIYKYSNSVKEGNVISQSISAGSEVSEGTTVTVMISKGKEPAASQSSSSSSSSGGSSGGSSSQSQKQECVKKDYVIDNLVGAYRNMECSSFDACKSAFLKFFNENYPGVSIEIVAEAETTMTSGSPIGCRYSSDKNCITQGKTVTSCNGVTYKFILAK